MGHKHIWGIVKRYSANSYLEQCSICGARRRVNITSPGVRAYVYLQSGYMMTKQV